MTVIAFQPKVLQLDGPWRTGELNTIVERLAPESSRGGARRWDVGITDIGDPQFYLLGPPHDECILCISRLGRLYVLEDGHGQLLFEHNSLLALAEQARVVLQKKKTQIACIHAALASCKRLRLCSREIARPVGQTQAREGDPRARLFRAAAGASRRSTRSPNSTASDPTSRVPATAVAIIQSNDDSGTVWNAACRNGT